MSALAAHLLEHRDATLDAWRAYGDVVPGRNISASLSRAQFNDHIPAVLDALSQSLHSWPGETSTVAAQFEADKVADHGVERWQQGYSRGIADEARESSTGRRRDMGGATTVASRTEAVSPGAAHGEGVGLSIVKRLAVASAS